MKEGHTSPSGLILCKLFVHVDSYMRDLAIEYPRSRPGGLEIYNLNEVKRGNNRIASR